MSEYQEITIQVRRRHFQVLQEIAQKEHGNANEVEKLIFTALLDYFEARSTNHVLEEAVAEGLKVLEEHLGVLLNLIKTLLISSSYDTSKTRGLLEYMFEKEIGKDLIEELYNRTGDSVIERLREEKLERTAQIMSEIEQLKRQLYDQQSKEASVDRERQKELEKQKSKEREYAEAIHRMTTRLNESEQKQRELIAWTNGLIQFMSQHDGDFQGLLQSYLARNPKPQGIV